MKDYELVVIYKPEITDENLPSTIEGMSKFIGDRGGAVTEVNRWGRRKLAYSIKGAAEGSYVFTRFKGEAKLLLALESNLKMSEAVLRHLLIRTEKPPAPAPAVPAPAPAPQGPQVQQSPPSQPAEPAKSEPS
ncbi:MAG: 30S ribosomal protein S6 [Chloroflexi bacterium]|nr:30S ribosomal protein S6 [Chloroflexota bacterium]